MNIIGVVYHRGAWFVEVYGREYIVTNQTPHHPLLYRGRDENRRVFVEILNSDFANVKEFA